MDDKKVARFTEKEKSILYGLFKQHQDIIDIRHRRSSHSQHKQTELRDCWNTIVSTFNASSDTTDRSIKQIQKFWLNSKLRKLLPSDETSKSSSSEKKSSTKILNGTINASKGGEAKVLAASSKSVNKKPVVTSIGASYQELARCYKQEEGEEEMQITDAYEDEYITDENISEAYIDTTGESITLKVIENENPTAINYGLTTTSTSDPSIVAISAPGQVTGTIVTVPASTSQTFATSLATAPTTTYITYSQLKNNLSPGTIKMMKNDGNIIITPQTEQIVLHTGQPRKEKRSSLTFAPQTSNIQSSPTVVVPSSTIISASQQPNTNVSTNEADIKRSIMQLQKEEMEHRLKEAKLKCEIQEIEKSKAKEELLQMREIHKMKIKEMELRLRNMERS